MKVLVTKAGGPPPFNKVGEVVEIKSLHMAVKWYVEPVDEPKLEVATPKKRGRPIKKED